MPCQWHEHGLHSVSPHSAKGTFFYFAVIRTLQSYHPLDSVTHDYRGKPTKKSTLDPYGIVHLCVVVLCYVLHWPIVALLLINMLAGLRGHFNAWPLAFLSLKAFVSESRLCPTVLNVA